MDGLQQDRLGLVARRNRRLGTFLTLIVVGLFIYSFMVIRHRGSLPEPSGLSPVQKMLRGL